MNAACPRSDQDCSLRAFTPSNMRRSIAKPIGSTNSGPNASQVATSFEQAERKRLMNRQRHSSKGSIENSQLTVAHGPPAARAAASGAP